MRVKVHPVFGSLVAVLGLDLGTQGVRLWCGPATRTPRPGDAGLDLGDVHVTRVLGRGLIESEDAVFIVLLPVPLLAAGGKYSEHLHASANAEREEQVLLVGCDKILELLDFSVASAAHSIACAYASGIACVDHIVCRHIVCRHRDSPIVCAVAIGAGSCCRSCACHSARGRWLVTTCLIDRVCDHLGIHSVDARYSGLKADRQDEQAEIEVRALSSTTVARHA